MRTTHVDNVCTSVMMKSCSTCLYHEMQQRQQLERKREREREYHSGYGLRPREPALSSLSALILINRFSHLRMYIQALSTGALDSRSRLMRPPRDFSISFHSLCTCFESTSSTSVSASVATGA